MSKYKAGVDATGAARAVHQQTQERADAIGELAGFSPEQIAGCLSSPLFHAYVHMVSLIELVPQKLALESELCVCHRPLLVGLSEHRKNLLFANHFGEGFQSCPMSGKLAPELVAGSLLEAFEGIWNLSEQELYVAETFGRSQLSLADRQV